jgi:hypothetical protein
MKLTKSKLKQIIKEELEESNFPDNREVQWRLIDQLVGATMRSDLERAEALRQLADDLEDRHHDEGAELGF